MTLWSDYRDSGSAAARDQLLARHLPLVHHVARRMHRTLAQETDLGDLVSAGTLGLIHAVESFDSGRGLAFSTYAAPRIQGSILDDLRRWDHASRSVRRKQREMAKAEDVLSCRLGRAPSEGELAEGLGIDRETLWSWRASVADTIRVSIDQPRSDGDSHPVPSIRDAVATNGGGIEDDLARREELDLLVHEIGRLRQQERVVLTLYFFQELKLHQIAKVLGLTESRISQIRTRALATLRRRMAYLRVAE